MGNLDVKLDAKKPKWPVEVLNGGEISFELSGHNNPIGVLSDRAILMRLGEDSNPNFVNGLISIVKLYQDGVLRRPAGNAAILKFNESFKNLAQVMYDEGGTSLYFWLKAPMSELKKIYEEFLSSESNINAELINGCEVIDDSPLTAKLIFDEPTDAMNILKKYILPEVAKAYGLDEKSVQAFANYKLDTLKN